MRELRKKRQAVFLYAMVLIPFTIYLFNTVIPLLTSVYYSLTKWKGIGSPKFIGFGNYVDLLNDSNFWLVTKNTLILMLYSVVGQIGIALILAFLMSSRNLKFKSFHRASIFFPVVMAPVVVAFVWKFFYNSNYGILNMFLKTIGLGNLIRNWLDDPSIILITVAIPVIWQYIGLYLIILMSAISGVPKEIYEAADIDGANVFQKSIYMTLPMIWNTLKISIILCASGAMKIYDQIYILTRGGPGRYSATMALYAYITTFDQGNFGLGSAIAISILIISLILAAIIQLLMGRKKVA
jgi:raffinose/stachyose/melibiose transport system permease protein